MGELPFGKAFHYYFSHTNHHSILGSKVELTAKGLHAALAKLGFVGFFAERTERMSVENLKSTLTRSCTVLTFVHDETCSSDQCRLEWKLAQKAAMPLLCVLDTSDSKRSNVGTQIRDTCPYVAIHPPVYYIHADRRANV